MQGVRAVDLVARKVQHGGSSVEEVGRISRHVDAREGAALYHLRTALQRERTVV
jgi:hypothetical protein